MKGNGAEAVLVFQAMDQEGLPGTEQKISRRKSSWNSVTPFSRYLALALIVVLPFLGGWIGYTYAPEKEVDIKNAAQKEADVQKGTETGLTESGIFSKKEYRFMETETYTYIDNTKYEIQNPPLAVEFEYLDWGQVTIEEHVEPLSDYDGAAVQISVKSINDEGEFALPITVSVNSLGCFVEPCDRPVIEQINTGSYTWDYLGSGGYNDGAYGEVYPHIYRNTFSPDYAAYVVTEYPIVGSVEWMKSGGSEANMGRLEKKNVDVAETVFHSLQFHIQE